MAAKEEFNAANAYCQNLRADVEEDVNPAPRAKGARKFVPACVR